MSIRSLQLDLFGKFHLRQGDQPVASFYHARLQHALAYLALHRTVPISRQQLAFLFWPESTDQQALKNLRTLLTRLRQALPDLDQFIDITAQTIQWRQDAPFTLDVSEFETALYQATAAQENGDYTGAADALRAAVNLYAGELLPDCYDDWILQLRERYHQTCSEALERLILLLEEHREYHTALPYARRLLNHDPLEEAAYHHLIRLHLALGDRTEALRVCRACDSMLEREFEIAPVHPTRFRYKRLLEEDDQPALVVIEQALGTRPSSLPLVGRYSEWSRLMAAWRSAATGHPQMVLLSGEAGIGKTRLAEEMCAWVARQGVTVAMAHCYPASGAAVAYAPLVEWLRADGLQARLASLEDIWSVEVARILPSLLAERPHLKSPGPLTEAWHRTRLFEAMARAVLGPDNHMPLLLFLDDLQWCDQETLDWLGYLLRFTAKAPMLILATVRKYEIDRVHPLMAFWLALTRSDLLSEILLEALEPTETGLLAANVAGRAIEISEANKIYHVTEGNPLFIVEMVRAGMADIASWSIPVTPATLPPKVRAIIEWRLTQVSPAAQALAQTAAAIGREFSFDVLVRACGQDEQAVIEGLDELCQRYLVHAQSATTYDFSHDGIRVVAYEDIAPIQRRAIHLRVAHALEELHQDNLDEFSSQIAGHYEQAGQTQPAITFYCRAASVAEGIFANAAAAHIYQHLLESDLRAGLSAAGRCTVMLALAEVWRATGQWTQAETISRNALAEAEALGDIHLAARAKRVLADVLHLLGYYDSALHWLAEAGQGFMAAGDPSGLAGTLWIIGKILWLRGDYPQALLTLEQQLEIATKINDPGSTCEALQAISMVLWSQGELERAADCCLKSIQIASPLEYKPILSRASITLGNIRKGEHWFGEAVYWYQRAGAIAREIDDRQALSWVIFSIAQILDERGDYERASAGYQSSLRIAWEIGDRWSSCVNVAGLATVNERLGRLDEAESLYHQAIDFGKSLNIPGYLSGMLIGLVRTLLAQGRLEEAHSVYEAGFSQIGSMEGDSLAGEQTRFEARVLGLRLHHALGELKGAQTAVDFRTLLLTEDSPLRQAELYYELWRLAPEDETARAAASARYRSEYTETGAEQCRRRYHELTCEMLPDPPLLPDVSDLIPDQQEGLKLAHLLNELKASFE